MKPIEVMLIKDPEVAKLFTHDIRRKMLTLMTYKEMSQKDLVKELGKPYSTIGYHLKLLEDAGLVKNVRSIRIQNLLQSYYRSSAKNYKISSDALS